MTYQSPHCGVGGWEQLPCIHHLWSWANQPPHYWPPPPQSSFSKHCLTWCQGCLQEVLSTYYKAPSGSPRADPFCNQCMDINQPPCIHCIDCAPRTQRDDVGILVGHHQGFWVSYWCCIGEGFSADAWGIWAPGLGAVCYSPPHIPESPEIPTRISRLQVE